MERPVVEGDDVGKMALVLEHFGSMEKFCVSHDLSMEGEDLWVADNLLGVYVVVDNEMMKHFRALLLEGRMVSPSETYTQELYGWIGAWKEAMFPMDRELEGNHIRVSVELTYGGQRREVGGFCLRNIKGSTTVRTLTKLFTTKLRVWMLSRHSTLTLLLPSQKSSIAVQDDLAELPGNNESDIAYRILHILKPAIRDLPNLPRSVISAPTSLNVTQAQPRRSHHCRDAQSPTTKQNLYHPYYNYNKAHNLPKLITSTERGNQRSTPAKAATIAEHKQQRPHLQCTLPTLGGELCNKMFSNRDTLKCHQSTAAVHATDSTTVYLCPHCIYTSRNKSNVTRHITKSCKTAPTPN
ncbi:hypothetical protein BJ508DRAFT_335882 [Ascobolus immersus RN42]|uniref:C2H2-type domain-containing protein n=1 Tax=Ascobolus immersus RN42 TaxID=1160509 RepID=A0A3N4HHU5_ASCIM|nr:hypothetical protein BJ508DRAFT_335882 [Ascobolus immersus RN42]